MPSRAHTVQTTPYNSARYVRLVKRVPLITKYTTSHRIQGVIHVKRGGEMIGLKRVQSTSRAYFDGRSGGHFSSPPRFVTPYEQYGVHRK